ncbi:tRNA guanosine(34) transglycosylase Tgt [Candidatus Gracilibacteria bacterium]|nr:tRNA guanosine(34) transglycosylase Tgt [Candidatus Gracilibacteria bacterium]
MNNLKLEKVSGAARAGVLKTRRGEIKTPVFMPVATRGAIKGGVSFEEMENLGAQIVLGNTYHLFLRPGDELIQKNFGDLHTFMHWNKSILTDSGGFQVFSIKNKKITDDGVFFNSHIDGKRFFLDAEKSIQIQLNLGADILMVFDECPPSKIANPTGLSSEKLERKLFFKVLRAVEKTTDWARKSKDHFEKSFASKISPKERPQLFGIIQGGCFSELRQKSLKEITAMDFDGFALGGLAVGESAIEMYKVLDEMCPMMPEEKPRYLMGVGTPENLIEAVSRGIDMFDCVLPARNARHGTIYTWTGKIRIANARYKEDKKVLNEACGCVVCADKKLSRAYLHHLFTVGEDLAKKYLTIHNLYFYQDLMRTMRAKILTNEFENWKDEVIKKLSV